MKKTLSDILLSALVLVSPVLAFAQTEEKSPIEVGMKIEVKIDSVQKGNLSEADISRAVEDGLRRALKGGTIRISKEKEKTPMVKGSIYDRYMKKQEKRGRHLQRVSREELQGLFVPKGQWMAGGSISYNEWDGGNLNYLVLKNIDFEGHTFSASPYFGYFIADNIAIGGRFSYSRYYFNMGQFDLNLGEDFNISLSDLYWLEHHYASSAFLRSYMPMFGSKVFGFFGEIRGIYSYANGKNSTGSGTEFDGSYEHVHTIQLGFCPGMAAFVTDFMAVEASIGVMGLRYRWKDQKTNQVETGSSKSGSANFKFNLFSVNLGMTFYL